MAASPSKNPPFSSIPSRSSNPRNSEVSNPIRRSFSGSPVARPSIITIQRPGFNPNTPANSPSGSFLFLLVILFSFCVWLNGKKMTRWEENLMGILLLSFIGRKKIKGLVYLSV